MKKIISTVAILSATCASPAIAVELSGAQVNGSFVSYTDSGIDREIFSITAGADVALSNTFSIGVNLGSASGSGDGEYDVINGTLHAMYVVPNSTWAVGGYFNSEDDENETVSGYGIEFGSQSATSGIELYLGKTETDGVDFSTYGGSFDMTTSSNFLVRGSLDSLRTSESGVDVTISSASIGAGYKVTSDISAFADIGSSWVSANDGTTYLSSDGSTFVRIGAQYNFGGAGGTVFSTRSFGKALANF
jgi:hypothetical protein